MLNGDLICLNRILFPVVLIFVYTSNGYYIHSSCIKDISCKVTRAHILKKYSKKNKNKWKQRIYKRKIKKEKI